MIALPTYQMSEAGCCTVTPSGLPLRKVARKKIHCILPSSPWLADSKTNIPLGVLYIAAVLREQGHEVVVTSMLNKRYEGNIHLPDEVMDSDVHMFGFCTPQFGECLELAAYIKDRVPDALVVAGGSHPSYEPREVKEAGRQESYHYKGTLPQRRDYRAKDGRYLFDTVVIMEGEQVVLQMLSDWENGKLQPYYNGDKSTVPDLDAVPYPAWDLLPDDHLYNDGVAVMKNRYFESNVRRGTWPVLSLIGARGCFPAGTPILLADGSQKLVELVQEGDLVATYDPLTGELGTFPILQAGVRDADDTYRLEFDDGTSVEVTGEHPFVTGRGWQTVNELHAGDTLRRVRNVWQGGRISACEGAGKESDLLAGVLSPLTKEVPRCGTPLQDMRRHSIPQDGNTVQRSPLAYERGDIRADQRLPIGRVGCPKCMERVTETPESGTCRDLGERIPGEWVRVRSVTFVGRSRVYPLTVTTHGTFIAAGLAVHNCPYKCTYCSTPWIGQKPRFRSPHNLIGEMQKAMDLGIKMFKFQDDTYTLGRKNLRTLAEAIYKHFGPDTFAARIHTRVNTMDDHVAESLKMMNCRVTCFGIESGSQKVLDANHKGTTVKQNTDALICAKKHGFYTIAFLVCGMSGETPETALETREWLASVKPYLDSCNLAVGIPYPGSRWWTNTQESGIDILDYNYDNQWIVGFSARDEILVRPHGTTIDQMFRVKEDMFRFLVEQGWAKSEWQEDVRIRTKQKAAEADGLLVACH